MRRSVLSYIHLAGVLSCCILRASIGVVLYTSCCRAVVLHSIHVRRLDAEYAKEQQVKLSARLEWLKVGAYNGGGGDAG